jgi:large subunit ribosomal protein L11
MAKEVIAQIKLQLEAGKASPAPPVGPALGQHNVNIMEFVKAFNDKTKNMEEGTIVPVLIKVYSDRKFDFIIKTPPASFLLKKAAKIIKGSGEPNKTKVGKVSVKQIEEIAKIKMKDLNTNDLEKAKKIIMGTAQSMGLEIINE